MRLVHFAGFQGCGKTSVIKRICNSDGIGFIANNESSAVFLKDVCDVIDFFPYKSPCARMRQYVYRLDLMIQNKPSVVITEPPGNCQEVSAPMLNQIFVGRKEIDLGPLMTVIDGRGIVPGISKRDSEGLRIFNMIDESDAVIISFSDKLSDEDKKGIVETISEINPDARIVFSDPDSDLSEVKELVFGDSKYNRPLYN